MPHHCPFPVHSTNSRHGYHTGSAPGFTLGLALVAALSGYAGFSHAAPAATPTIAPQRAQAYAGWAKGRLLVAPRPGLSAAEFDKAMKPHNARSRGYIKQLNTHVIELPAGMDEVTAMKELRKNRKLKYVELDMAVAPAASVTDPSYGSSWALPKIQAPTAWDSANGSGVTIAILDTGIDSTHPDLVPNLVPGWNVYDNNANTADVHGHGTWVAGVAAMAANNGKGSAGVAWGAKIMPVRIADPNAYAYWSTVAQGIYWAADHGAKVVNVSYNGVSGSATIQSAAQYLRSKGGVVVVAAGNSGALESIAANDSLLTVAATDQNDARASFSSYGAYVDVAAPGVSVYTTAIGGGYSNASGTSFSSPIVAATAALMLSANSRLTPADVDRILKTTALDLGTSGYDSYYGSGRINAASAVSGARQTVVADTQAPTVSIASPTGGRVSGVVPVDVNYSDNIGVVRADFYVNGQLVASDSLAPFAFAWDTAGKADGSYTLSVQAYDAAGNRGTSPSVAVTLGNDSTAPTVSSFSLTDGMTISPTKQTIKVSATDSQGVAKISLIIDGKEVAITYGGSLSYNWNTRKLAKGAHTVTVRVTDTAGNVTSRTVTVYR
ncbi:MAG: S8 family serine peptidase [Thiobacillus sp.]|nr:S8 family serine peptidase [Thiobacillus sp.]